MLASPALGDDLATPHARGVTPAGMGMPVGAVAWPVPRAPDWWASGQDSASNSLSQVEQFAAGTRTHEGELETHPS